MDDKADLLVAEYHESVFREFWLNSYSARIHYIGNSVGEGFDRLAIEFHDHDFVLGNVREYSVRARDVLADLDSSAVERAVAEYYEFCFRNKHSLLDPATKIPVPAGLWRLPASQIIGDRPLFKKSCVWKKRLAKCFAWLLWKVFIAGIISFALGLLCIPDFGLSGPTLLCFSVVLIAVAFQVVESVWRIRDNAEFIGDVGYDIIADKNKKDYSELGIIKVANTYLRYLEARYAYLGRLSHRILALYLTAVYFRPFLRGQKPYTLMHQIIKSCLSLKMRDVIKFNDTMTSFTCKFSEEESWTVVCVVCMNFFYFGSLKGLKVDVDAGVDCASSASMVRDSDVSGEEAVRICEGDFSYIEPLLNETHSEARFDQAFKLARLSLSDWEFNIVMIAKSHLQQS